METKQNNIKDLSEICRYVENLDNEFNTYVSSEIRRREILYLMKNSAVILAKGLNEIFETLGTKHTI